MLGEPTPLEVQQLEEFGELLLTCPDGAAWLEALRQAQLEATVGE